MKLYKAEVCSFSDESKVAKFLFPSPLQFSFLWQDRNLLSRSSPPIYVQSLFLIGYGLLFVVICHLLLLLFAFTLVAGVAVQIMLGNVVTVYPETVQGLTFYCSNIYIYITKILACVTSAKSLLWNPRLVTSMK